MRKASVRELHLNTSAIIEAVKSGEVFMIEKRGQPVAELRPRGQAGSRCKLPNRERSIAQMRRVVTDTGRILEEDRS